MMNIHNLHLRKQKKILCDQFSITIIPGMIIGILGANGCGKTTLLHTLSGLSTPAGGSIQFNHQTLSSLPPKQLASFRGILFQDFQAIMPISVFDYCLASRYPHQPFGHSISQADKKITQTMLEKCELAALAERPINQLSGGEKQRLAIAALLTQQPQYYFLDEPANHLDIRHQLQLFDHFTYLAQYENAAIIMSLHDVNLAQRYCSHLILMLPEGRLLQGTPETILTEYNLSTLYDCNMKAFQSGQRVWWQASNNVITSHIDPLFDKRTSSCQ